jgi:anti-sigma factor RsiW
MDKRNDEMELLSAYIDEELNETEKKRVEDFLSTSPAAKKAIRDLHQSKAFLMSLPPVIAPEDFLDKLELQAEAAQQKLVSQPSFWRRANPLAWASSFAMAACVALLSIGLYPQRQIPFETLANAHMTMSANSGIHQRVLTAAHYTQPARASQNAGV